MRQRLAKIWTESSWHWVPGKLDHGFCEQSNLPVQTGALNTTQFTESRNHNGRAIQEHLDQSSRDKVLAIVLSTCQAASMTARVASAFPSVEVVDTLMQLFLASHFCQADSWLHLNTLNLNSQWPGWLGAAIAAGAVLTPETPLRKFGFALQEAVRLAIPRQFEHNNSTTRDLGSLQGFTLQLDIGRWSGNRRKMEIAESHSQAPITVCILVYYKSDHTIDFTHRCCDMHIDSREMDIQPS
jgi:hypothetical protein